jgi:hypothetical protein
MSDVRRLRRLRRLAKPGSTRHAERPTMKTGRAASDHRRTRTGGEKGATPSAPSASGRSRSPVRGDNRWVRKALGTPPPRPPGWESQRCVTEAQGGVPFRHTFHPRSCLVACDKDRQARRPDGSGKRRGQHSWRRCSFSIRSVFRGRRRPRPTATDGTAGPRHLAAAADGPVSGTELAKQRGHYQRAPFQGGTSRCSPRQPAAVRNLGFTP